MMGTSHAVSGWAAGALLVPVLAVDQTATTAVAVAAVAGGWALWPDLDQGGIKGGRVHGSTAARTWGPITALMAAGVGKAADGHRNGTHSLPGVAVFTLLAWLATFHPVSTSILVALSVGLGLRAASWLIPGRREKVWSINLAVSVTAAWALVYGVDYRSMPLPLIDRVEFTTTPVEFGWLPAVAAVGMLAHILGDMLTPEGCPLLWPFSKRRFGLGLFTTSTPVEALLVVPLLAGLVVVGFANAGLLDPVIDGLAGWAGGPTLGYWTVVGVVGVAAGLLAMREHGGSR